MGGAIQRESHCILSSMDGQRTRWAECFEHFSMVVSPNGCLLITGLEIADDDQPIDKIASSLNEAKKVAERLTVERHLLSAALVRCSKLVYTQSAGCMLF